ncbi:MAG: phosphoribosylamine--glycine ligase [Flavobacteriales bacterium]|nr:phosphoribosylamine--glycine ligase [Flavobacteriales bacterium]|tara:strand:- start:36830 stop:38116 length:1287 start_codon:yes stop_codon:yes gene_type:complete
MNVLVLGSGGREHAISWKLAQSPKLSKLYVAPGNAGTTELAENLNIDVNDFNEIKKAVLANNINLVIVGPEDPLVNGVVDFFLKDEEIKNIPIIGPQAEAAQLEGSKEYSKRFMQRNNVPTAGYESFTKETLEKGLNYLETQNPPYVLKADGLAAGKGVVILNDLTAAKKELKAMLADAKFGDASRKVVIEEFMSGIELSVFVITDGKDYVILPEAKDYKRIGEGDTGLNTGGMGAISPVPFADDNFMKRVEEEVVIPTIDGFKKENLPYKGFVFIGLMNDDGNPRVVEYNVRMGDPETEVVMPRLKTDLLEIMQAVADEKLRDIEVEFEDKSATTVIMVSGGYPEAYEKGHEISGLDKTEGSIIFHAGTKEDNGKVFTNGGRVIAVTSYGKDFNEALKQSYKNTEIIDWEEKYFRSDLGFDLQKYLN